MNATQAFWIVAALAWVAALIALVRGALSASTRSGRYLLITAAVAMVVLPIAAYAVALWAISHAFDNWTF